eukprot:g460.t1
MWQLAALVAVSLGGTQEDLLAAHEKADAALVQIFEVVHSSPEQEQQAWANGIDAYKELLELQKAAYGEPIVGDMHQLSLLIMSTGKWEAAHQLCKQAVDIDPFNFKSLNVLGYSHEGMRKDWNQKPFIPDHLLGALYASAEDPVSDATGLLERFYHKMTQPKAACCAGQSRWVAGLGVHYKMTVGAIVKVLAFHEYQLRLGNHSIPQLAVLSQTPKGDGLGLPPQSGDPVETAAKFAKQDFMIIRGVLPPFVKRVAMKYYGEAFGVCKATPDGRDTICTKAPRDIFPENGGGGHVHSISSDRFGYFLNEYLKPVVELLAARKLQVSYSYFVQYRGKPGNPGLLPHIDMIDNEYTMTISIDWSDEDFGPVPIYVHRDRVPPHEQGRNVQMPPPNTMEKVMLPRGDGMLFRGREHPHYRDALPGGKSCSNLLVHFVKMDFPTNMTREAHNNMVCCQWPPREKYNYEDCSCADRNLMGTKRKLVKEMEGKWNINDHEPTEELIHRNRVYQAPDEPVEFDFFRDLPKKNLLDRALLSSQQS